MRCNEAAEFVSALCDGEQIPRAAAEHVGGCPVCQRRMRDYLEMGAELCRVASLDRTKEAAPRQWERPQGRWANIWRKGWNRMSVPRVVFVSMVAGIAVLGSGLAVVGARARTAGTVVLLKISTDPGASNVCALSTVDQKDNLCAFMGGVKTGLLQYELRILAKHGDSVTLGVRAVFSSEGKGASSTMTPAALESLPERQYSFTPGCALQVNVADLGDIAVTGEWMDHVPALINNEPHAEMDPAPGELRVISPLILRGNRVAADEEGGSATVDKPNWAVDIFAPAQGRFELSLSPMPGAVRGKAQLNRISFEASGESYSLLAGAPLTRAQQVWVRFQLDYKPANPALATGYIGTEHLSSTDAGGATKN
jgi:anti-sigma-K factor RskA